VQVKLPLLDTSSGCDFVQGLFGARGWLTVRLVSDEPIVNFDETPGKVVGRRHPPKDGLALTEAQSAANALAWKRAFGTLRIPRGVYRFRTHEQADEWLWEKLTRPRN
jgi:hypothetical protein